MLFIPGQQAIFTFTVPDGDGNNISGLSWTVLAISKDNQRLTSGSEFTSFSIVEHVSGLFYLAVFTPLSSSSSIYMISAKSDATVPDYFELHLEPDWANIVLLAQKIEHVLGNPELVRYYMPDGVTIAKTYTMTQAGSLETREAQ